MVRAVVLVAAVAAVISRGGQGGAPSGATPTAQPTHPSPADSPSESTIRHAGFTTKLPVGWADATNRSNARSGKSFAAVLTSHSTGASLVVSVVPAAPDGATVLRSVVTGQDGYDVAGPRPYRLGGAHGTTASFKKRLGNGAVAHDRLVFVNHGAFGFAIAFSAPALTYGYTSSDLAEMLSAWRWTRSQSTSPA